jgi:predicted nucleotide-binding protein
MSRPSKPQKKSGSKSLSNDKSARAYVSQTDVPSVSLEQAIRVPTAIAEHYAGGSVTSLQLASGMMLRPTSGQFRQLCGAAFAYGLTSGSYNSDKIKLEQLGRRIVQTVEEGDDLAAKREASLRPRVASEFLRKYDGSALPRSDIALDVITDMGVPREKAEVAHALILENAEAVGLIRKIKEKQYVDLNGASLIAATGDSTPASSTDDLEQPCDAVVLPARQSASSSLPGPQHSAEPNRRVFITHGQNRLFIEPIKKLLGFGEMIPVISVEKTSVSKPVPDKVIGDMRTCGAAIIHVDADETLIDKDAKEHVIINENVLIEIGAAMALFGRRFILLVRDGVRLPSNLQGLYEVRYSGDALDGNTTIRLLEAINDIKNHPLPTLHAAPEIAG